MSFVIATRFQKTVTNIPPYFIHIEHEVSQVLSREFRSQEDPEEKTPDGGEKL